MKKTVYTIVLILLLNGAFAQIKQQYTNPILAGFYPDPSICKANNAYYLVNSTFAYFPGLPIFKSNDLVHWKQIGNAIDRPSQMDFEGAGVSRGLFAPTIRFHKGLFYITCTEVDKKGNFVITATNPAGPWSDPVLLPEVNGIDPSLFFDENKTYIIYNSIPPENKSLYDGHRTIRINEFDPIQLKVVGDNIILVNGGTDISLKPSWIEGPHLIKKDGKYILYAAQGGTGFNHSEVAFKSNEIFGAYIPFSKKPILQQNYKANNPFPITSTGHADIVETVNGKWSAVFLGCRPYESDYYNTGRETFLAPVEWKDGWPIINPNFETVQYHYEFPLPSNNSLKAETNAGNFEFKDDFNSDQLQNGWLFLRAPKSKWYSLKENKGSLVIKLQAQTCSDKTNSSMILRRQQHIQSEASVSLLFNTSKETEKAGLLLFQNETHYYFLCKSVQNNKPVVQLYKSTETGSDLIATQELDAANKELQLKIVTSDSSCRFYYATNQKDWKPVASNMDITFLSTKTAGGFVGTMYALYSSSNGLATTNNASYQWFQYKGNDEALK